LSIYNKLSKTKLKKKTELKTVDSNNIENRYIIELKLIQLYIDNGHLDERNFYIIKQTSSNKLFLSIFLFFIN
jgi:hypothetical protein